jgi:opacity protein-like surface antigen
VFGEPTDQSATDVLYLSGANRWQWSFNLGVGLEYPVVKNLFVYIDFRTSFGSTNLGQHDGAANLPVLGFAESLDVRYLEFILSVAYAFELDWAQTKKGKSTVKKRKTR